jgi:hypothetical protein
MIPIGYNTKIIELPKEWLGNSKVKEILSVSECISESPIDHTSLWLCNNRLLYNSPKELNQALAESENASPYLRRFFYEAYELSIFDDCWEPIEDLPDNVIRPDEKYALRGYDIVCFSSGVAPECSPLSCNSGAKDFPVNQYCLIDTLDDALQIAEAIDKDGGYEPGPYGILSVWEQIS